MDYTKDNRHEVLDQEPVAIPLGMKKPESMHDIIARLIGNRFADIRMDSEHETFEEADDFDCDDDFDPNSPWEEVFDQHGNSLGFLDQNRYQKPKLYERRLDDREQREFVDKTNNGDNGSGQSASVGSDSERSE